MAMRGDTVLLALITGCLAYLTLVPMAILVWGSFLSAPPGVDGELTLDKYVEAFSAGSKLFPAAANTLVFALGGSTVAFLLGAYFAWLVERTNMPFKGAIFVLMLVPHILPGVLKAYGWLLLLSPRTGVINVALRALLQHDVTLSIYSMPAMVWVFAADSVTLPFLIMLAAFRSMDPALEEAATTSGAGTVRVLRKVTLPVLLPAFLAGWMLVFIHAMEDFEVPAVIGLPAKIHVFATEIWFATTGSPSDLNLASVYAVSYLVPSLLILWWYSRATRASERFATITGKNFRPAMNNLGRWLGPVGLVSLGVLMLQIILPFLAIIWASLIPYYQPPSVQALGQVSLTGFSWTLTRSATYESLFNTAAIGISSTTFATLLGAVIAWIVLRTSWRGRRLLDFLAFSPIAVSGTLFGLALIWFYLTVPFGDAVYGTIWIVSLGYIAKFLPQSMRFNYAALGQVHRELEEASAMSGADWATTFRRVVVPLIMPGLAAAWIYVIALTFKVLSLPVMLSGVNNKVLSVLIFELVEQNQTQRLAALGVLLVALLAVMTLAARVVSRRFGVQHGQLAAAR